MARIVALAGGVGGAKLAHGLQAVLRPGDLTVVVNTADDTEQHGLLVCPDHDTVMYTLAGLANPEQGWGLEGETYAATGMLGRYGEETWFRLGDRDLATHIARTARLRAGGRLTDVLLGLQRSLGVPSVILPMADEPIRTRIRTQQGWLDFQDYFVRLHQAPDVLEVRFEGHERARPTPEVLNALGAADLVILCPSNPVVSIGPILSVPGLQERIGRVPVVAVSPIVGGKALKGPADRMLVSLGHESRALGVARIYERLATHFVLDVVDADEEPAIRALGQRTLVTETVMTDDAARARLAHEVVEHALA